MPTVADAEVRRGPTAAAPDPGEFPSLQAATQYAQTPTTDGYFDAELSCLQRLKRGMAACGCITHRKPFKHGTRRHRIHATFE